jgi:prepilin-type N-terminal cleavage/methylation domain-containing protein
MGTLGSTYLARPVSILRPRRPETGGSPRSCAFTLIELLIVIVILGILAGISLTIANRVVSGGKSQATENVLRALDQIATSAVTDGSKSLPSMYADPIGNIFPIADGRFVERTFQIVTEAGALGETQQRHDLNFDPPQPSLTLLLLALNAEQAGYLAQLDQKFIAQEQVPAWGWVNDGSRAFTQFSDAPGSLQPPLKGIVVRDGFGRPIRYAHPAFDGGGGSFAVIDQNQTPPITLLGVRDEIQLTHVLPPNAQLSAELSRSYRPFRARNVGTCLAPRAVGDADEGTYHGLGYFYSSGLDLDPGTWRDNVYTNRPEFPPETRDQNLDDY